MLSCFELIDTKLRSEKVVMSTIIIIIKEDIANVKY